MALSLKLDLGGYGIIAIANASHFDLVMLFGIGVLWFLDIRRERAHAQV